MNGMIAQSDKATDLAQYKFELPIGARIFIGGNVFLHSGGGVFVGDKCPLIIECSLSESQLSSEMAKSFVVQKAERSNEVLAREIYLASGDIPTASAMADAVSNPEVAGVGYLTGDLPGPSLSTIADPSSQFYNPQSHLLGPTDQAPHSG